MQDEKGNSGESGRSEAESAAKEKADFQRLFKRFRVFFAELLSFLGDLLSIRHDTDYEKTREGIIRDIPFRGPTIYILICSVFIASIGLNLNSPAVIIGAMLIAPLMGPILGAGFAVGVNDAPLLLKSLKNFGVMVFVSLITATMYFSLTPLVEYQPELLSRTKPTTLDIFVAIFGGVAGIVAGSRKEKSNVIPGVAIATALMPPLCTSGFGLATGNWGFFFGAFYLFLLNSIFICAATIIGVRYLRFPMKVFVDAAREKRVKFYMTLGMVIIIIPSLYIFWGVLKESYFRSHAEAFISNVVKMEGARVVSSKLIYSEESPTIELFLIGNDVPEDTVAIWKSQMPYYKLENARLDIYKGGGTSGRTDDIQAISGRIRADIVEDLFVKSQDEIMDREAVISDLRREVEFLRGSGVKIGPLSKELKIQFEDLEKVSFAQMVEAGDAGLEDTIPTFMVRWSSKASRKEIDKNEDVLANLMKLRLDLDTVRVVRY